MATPLCSPHCVRPIVFTPLWSPPLWSPGFGDSASEVPEDDDSGLVSDEKLVGVDGVVEKSHDGARMCFLAQLNCLKRIA